MFSIDPSTKASEDIYKLMIGSAANHLCFDGGFAWRTKLGAIQLFHWMQHQPTGGVLLRSPRKSAQN